MTVSTIVGTLVAFLMVPMQSLVPDNWKTASALMGNYIGGCKFPEMLVLPILRAFWYNCKEIWQLDNKDYN